MKKALTILILLVLAGGLVYAGTFLSPKERVLGAEILVPATSSNSTSTATSTVATLLVAARSQANYRAFTNLGANSVSIGCVTTSTGFAYGQGYILTPSSTWEMSEEKGNLCRNSMYFISTAGTPTVSVYQLP